MWIKNYITEVGALRNVAILSSVHISHSSVCMCLPCSCPNNGAFSFYAQAMLYNAMARYLCLLQVVKFCQTG